VDSSKRADELGFKVHVIKSGEHKGMGLPGVEISEEQIESIQKIVNAIAENFISSVAKGRGMDKEVIRTLATGELWIAKTAKKLGLIDKVTVNTVQKVEKNLKGQSMNEEKQNNEVAEEKTQAQVKAAVQQATAEGQKRMAELQEAFADDLDFAVQSFGKGLTVEQAKAEYCDILQQRNKEAAEKKASLQNKDVKVAGAKAIATDGSDDAGQGNFISTAKELAKAEGIKLGAAYKRIAREQPELYQAHIGGLGLVREKVA
jgi:ClpP class serine protease